jgi:hypothetical protein
MPKELFEIKEHNSFEEDEYMINHFKSMNKKIDDMYNKELTKAFVKYNKPYIKERKDLEDIGNKTKHKNKFKKK